MKKLPLIAALTLMAVSGVSAQTLITGFTFETSVPAAAGPFTAENGSPATTLGFHAGTSTYSSPAGNGSTHSFSSTNWAVGDYYQFTLSTAGFSGIYVAYGEASSNTGPGTFTLQYSTNAGTTFTTLPAYTLPAGSSFNVNTANPLLFQTYDLTSITALNNNPNVVFRVTDASTTSLNGGTVASTGTSRIDDFNVSTGGFITPAVVPEPATWAYVVAGLGVIALMHRRRLA